ncbi:ROK family protein [Ornithinibacillus sp. L9]|uniref:ROK family protein n=1 Tax=Ornithinibacillus caprae TaxID=2678566 RepID=A0A6N8FPV3_9BACI|nr:ROK family transcriptional regulator [Ornithinibacillus caprae]MUK90217.1 ROK family protein [Ornithinibacillus caprae]
MKRGTFQLMKSVNKSIILNKIRTGEPISRAQIAKETTLTPPTVSSIVKELIEEGIVRESELGESKGGRKPTMLLINHSAFFVVGVDAGPNKIGCVLADLSGKIYERTSIPLQEITSNEQFLSILVESIRTILKRVDQKGNVIGIGVAMHGVVDVETGTSLVAPNLQLRDIPIKETLENEFQMVIKVENDARAMALGESWFGNHGSLNSMLAVNLGSGVGAGVVINGKLYHGAQDIAGEVGHMTIDMHGEVCECGNRGCLQTFATGSAIAEQAGVDSGEEVFRLANEGNEKYATILKETGAVIGVGLTNLIHIINPQVIVLGGGVAKSQKYILPSIQQTIEERGLTKAAKETKVVISNLGDDATLLGAVALLLVELFE